MEKALVNLTYMEGCHDSLLERLSSSDMSYVDDYAGYCDRYARQAKNNYQEYEKAYPARYPRSVVESSNPKAARAALDAEIKRRRERS
jgi:hypothetical protein